jgi:hypothetical protein
LRASSSQASVFADACGVVVDARVAVFVVVVAAVAVAVAVVVVVVVAFGAALVRARAMECSVIPPR